MLEYELFYKDVNDDIEQYEMEQDHLAEEHYLQNEANFYYDDEDGWTM